MARPWRQRFLLLAHPVPCRTASSLARETGQVICGQGSRSSLCGRDMAVEPWSLTVAWARFKWMPFPRDGTGSKNWTEKGVLEAISTIVFATNQQDPQLSSDIATCHFAKISTARSHQTVAWQWTSYSVAFAGDATATVGAGCDNVVPGGICAMLVPLGWWSTFVRLFAIWPFHLPVGHASTMAAGSQFFEWTMEFEPALAAKHMAFFEVWLWQTHQCFRKRLSLVYVPSRASINDADPDQTRLAKMSSKVTKGYGSEWWMSEGTLNQYSQDAQASAIFKAMYLMFLSNHFKSKLMFCNDVQRLRLDSFDLYLCRFRSRIAPPASILSGMLCSGSVSACDKAGRWPMTLELLRFTQQLRVLNRVSYNAAISACETKSKWQQAVSVMYQMTLVRRWFIVYVDYVGDIQLGNHTRVGFGCWLHDRFWIV